MTTAERLRALGTTVNTDHQTMWTTGMQRFRRKIDNAVAYAERRADEPDHWMMTVLGANGVFDDMVPTARLDADFEPVTSPVLERIAALRDRLGECLIDAQDIQADIKRTKQAPNGPIFAKGVTIRIEDARTRAIELFAHVQNGTD